MQISAEYRELNRRLHETNGAYGAHSSKWALLVEKIAKTLECRSVLDFACGKGTLGMAIGHKFDWREYDPAIPGKDNFPGPADLVVATDVLEHVEPEYLDDFLDSLERLAVKAVFMNVATRPARKFLEDGRNAHLTIEPIEWWIPKLNSRFAMRYLSATPSEFEYTGVAK